MPAALRSCPDCFKAVHATLRYSTLLPILLVLLTLLTRLLLVLLLLARLLATALLLLTRLAVLLVRILVLLLAHGVLVFRPVAAGFAASQERNGAASVPLAWRITASRFTRRDVATSDGVRACFR